MPIGSSPRRIRTSPAAHSCTTAAASRGEPPIASQAWHVPSVGCPAKGSSADGREDAHPVVGPGSDGGSTNVVSDRFVQCAICCMSASLRPLASSTTATGFPR